MKRYGRMDVQIHVFVTSTLIGGEWSASRSCLFTPEKEISVDPRTSVNDLKKRKFLALPELEFRPLVCPVILFVCF
jgi:hypothetical protein